MQCLAKYATTIKFGIGILKLPKPPDRFISERIRRAEYYHLPIELEHVLNDYELPPIHRDPFDRLLVCQAKVEGLTILTADPIFANYSVKTIDFADIG